MTAEKRDHIFISYRRDDARGASGRLYDWLRIAFGRECVFRDVASIGPGKWKQRIDDALAASVVCLPVIGSRWCDDTNGPQLHADGDMVRHEILSALDRGDHGLTLIPTLVDGAPTPPRARLPAEMHALLDWNAYPLSEAGWEDDMRRLIDAVAQSAGTRPAGDIDSLLARAHEAEARMRALEQERDLQAEQIRALTDSVHALTRQLAEAPATERTELSEALAALARGENAAAEAEFERVLEAKSAQASAAAEEGAKATQEAAEAARHLASLAMLHDAEKALRYYRRAADLEPEDTWTWFFIGDLLRTLGDLAAAMQSFAAAAATINSRLDANADEAGALRDLSVSHNKIGDVLVAQGDGPGALEAYRKSLAIFEALAARDPANTDWQRDLIVSYVKLSEVTGDTAYVLQALAIAEDMEKRGVLAPRDAWMIEELKRRAAH